MSDLGSIAIEGLSLLAAVASLAVTAVLLRVVLGSYIISMDEPAFRNFSRSGHMMLVAMVLFGIAMLARPVDYFTYDFLELLAILLFLAAVLIFVNYFKKGGSGERLLTRLDWGELEKEVKLKEVERDLKEDVAFRRFLPAAKGMHFVLVEVGQGVAPFSRCSALAITRRARDQLSRV